MTSGKCLKVSKFSKRIGPSPAAVAKKALLRRIQKQEIRRLQAVLPSTSRMASAKRPTEGEAEDCAVIYSAIRYIDQLHATILARVRSGSLPIEVLDRINLGQMIQTAPHISSRRMQVPSSRNSALFPPSSQPNSRAVDFPPKSWIPQ